VGLVLPSRIIIYNTEREFPSTRRATLALGKKQGNRYNSRQNADENTVSLKKLLRHS
jgi:hypothetical protein